METIRTEAATDRKPWRKFTTLNLLQDLFMEKPTWMGMPGRNGGIQCSANERTVEVSALRTLGEILQLTSSIPTMQAALKQGRTAYFLFAYDMLCVKSHSKRLNLIMLIFFNKVNSRITTAQHPLRSAQALTKKSIFITSTPLRST